MFNIIVIKKILSWLVFVALFSFVILGFALKGKINNYLSGQMKNSVTPALKSSGRAYIDSAFNYTNNMLSYSVTFIEFGSKGCSACTRMEAVMDDFRAKYPKRVNVVFLNILKPENQVLMKYYGVVAIPTQVLLDKEGVEFYRHTGYISTQDLYKIISTKM